jgi:hypothetical protein
LRRKRIKLYQSLKNQWGKWRDKDRNFDKIAAFFYHNLKKDNAKYFVGDNTFHDLNLEGVFLIIDHTQSKIGEQYLYYVLRTPKKSEQEFIKFNCRIESLCKDEEKRIEIQKQLSALNNRNDYYIADLLFHDLPKQPSYFWVIYLLQILTIASIVFSFFFPVTILALGIIFPVNFFLHYKTRAKFEFLFQGLERIQTMYSITVRLIKLVENQRNDVVADISACKKIISKLWIFKKNNSFGDEISQLKNLIFDVLKILFLLEVWLAYKISAAFDARRKNFLNLFCYLGEIDVALSVASFRKSLTSYCIPEFEENAKRIFFENAFHPLINNCVVNDFDCRENKSVFINGSNMSGKTSFIRTIGINALLATTIYTCTAAKATLPFFNIYSVIKIEDDVETGVSYYFEELLRLKELVEVSNADEKQCNLFLIDEILKGTNIHDRTKIAKSILRYLNASDHNMIMVTSHDIDLAEQLKNEFSFYYFKENINEKDLDFDYKIYKGLSTKSNAVNLLKILDFPTKIIMDSNE